MRKPKSYNVSPTLADHSPPPFRQSVPLVTGSPVFELEVDAASRRRVDYQAHMGKGFDAWVWAGLEALRSVAGSGSVAQKTLLNYAGAGWPRWLEFLIASQGPTDPKDLRPEHIRGFMAWLARRHPFGTSARTTYAQVKPMLVAMSNLGLGPADVQRMFPIKAFSKSTENRQSPKALSGAEVLRLAQALKKDLVAIHRGTFTGPDSEALVVSFLVVALRTGINTTPLLEATRDCLWPNPLMPNMMLMRTFKRRGKGHQSNPMRQFDGNHGTSVVPMDGVAVLRGVLARTEQLSTEAPPKIRNRIWLYRSRSRHTPGALFALSQSGLDVGIQRFARRHGLLGDDGKLLIPTPTRLRKTMEAKLWALSGGDLMTVAAAIGHTPDVADQHYLSLTEDMKADAARFVGLALPEVLRGKKTVQAPMPVSIRTTVQNTPVGKCANSLTGKHAPHNGKDHCDRFTECLTCPTYVVIGSVKDLHRLFSFQLFLESEIEYMAAPELASWRDHKRELIGLIDQFTAARFAHSVVEEAKALAIKTPHPFWAARMSAGSRLNGGLHAG